MSTTTSSGPATPDRSERLPDPPFRADHVGSLLRPPTLLAARAAHAAGGVSAERLREAEDAAITEVVALQEELGLRAATDGEYRRTSWHMDFIYQLGGIHRTDQALRVAMRNAGGEQAFTTAGMVVDGPVRLEHPIFAEDFRYLADRARTAVAKLTVPSPSMVHYRAGTAAIDRDVYPDLDGFWHDLAGAYQAQVHAMGELGCRYLQFDDTSLAYLNDPAQREMITARGDDAEGLHLRYIELVNASLADRPPGMRVTTHLCRGNYRSAWAAEGGYDFVAEALFGGLEVDGFFCEFDDERSGGFAPLRFVPPGKRVVLGLVTSKRPELEPVDELRRRVDEAARYVPMEQLCLSPQCGFSSTVEGNALTLDQQRAKLDRVVEAAAVIWG